MTLKTIHGEPVKDLASAIIVSVAKGKFLVETLRLNKNRLTRLGLDPCFACDCCRMADHEYQPEDYDHG